MRGMKWWGWGDEGVAFSHEDKPGLGPFIKRHLDVDLSHDAAPPVSFDDLRVPAPRSSRACGPRSSAPSDHARLDRRARPRGPRLRQELARPRAPRAAATSAALPDVVVWPGNEAGRGGDRCRRRWTPTPSLIPFGGGTNISGSLEAPADEDAPIVSRRPRPPGPGARDRRRLAPGAGAGGRATGPHLEAQLNARGWTLGHFPDSFSHSTLGGWIATRSSGMQSDKYGDMADLTRGLRVVTPAGTLAHPARAEHLDRARACARWCSAARAAWASSPRPPCTCTACPSAATILGYLFPTWADALAAMQDLAASEASPSVTRVSDAYETAFSFATRKAPTPLDRVKSSRAEDLPARRRGFDLEAMCLSFIGYEGSAAPRRGAAADGRADRRPPRRPVHRPGPGRAVRPEEVRHALHPRLPARPRRAGRRVGDLGAVEPPVDRSTTT